MRSKYKKVSPEYIAKRFLIDNYVYSDIKVCFGLDNYLEYYFWTIVPISYTGAYAIVFSDFDGNILHYASHLGNCVIDFIEKEIVNFIQLMGKTADTKVIIDKHDSWFDDYYKRRVAKDDEFAESD